MMALVNWLQLDGREKARQAAGWVFDKLEAKFNWFADDQPRTEKPAKARVIEPPALPPSTPPPLPPSAPA